MSDYKVSLIVPVFNSEAHLVECLDSVVAQTIFDEIQVLVIDDGSADSSLRIAQTYAAAHANVFVTTQPNGGPGAARNHGLRLAEADYIAFLDADDILTTRSVEARWDALTSSGADLVVAAFQIFPREIVRPSGALMTEDRVFEGLAECHELIDNASVWNKLFRREFFDRPENLFPENAHFEDAHVSVSALLEARRICVIAEVCYLYRRFQEAGSIMGRVFDRTDNYWDHIRLNETLYARFRESSGSLGLLDRFLIRSIRGFLYNAHSALVEPDLRRFFDQARDLYARYSYEDVAPYATMLNYQIGLYSVLADDYAMFSSPMTEIIGCEATTQGVRLQIRDTPDPTFRDLLLVEPGRVSSLGTPQLLLENITWTDGISLQGSVSMTGGEKLPISPVGLEFTAVPGGSPMRITRSESGPRDGRWSVVLPLDSLSEGRQTLKFTYLPTGKNRPLVVEDSTGLSLPWTHADSLTTTTLDVHPEKMHVVATRQSTRGLGDKVKGRLASLRRRSS